MKKQTRVSIGLYALAATMVCVILLAPGVPDSIIKPLCLAMLACWIVLPVIIPARSKNGRARVWAGLRGLLPAALPLLWFLRIAIEPTDRYSPRLIFVVGAWVTLAVIVGSLLVRRKRQENQEWTARFAADRQRQEEEQATNKD